MFQLVIRGRSVIHGARGAHRTRGAHRAASALAAAVLAGVTLGVAGTTPARAGATIMVTTTSDTGGAGCSLRQAVISADTDTASGGCVAGSGADTIRVPAGTYVLDRTGKEDDASLTGDLDLTGTVTILGAGAGVTIVDGYATVGGGTADRVLDVQTGAVVRLSGATVTGGNGSFNGNGGDILQHPGSQLTISRSVISRGTGAFGGGVLVSGAAFPEFAGPRAGITVGPATLTIIDSTISDNVSITDGGGLWVGPSATLTLVRSTVTRNVARHGDGISNAGSALLTNDTITNNGDWFAAPGRGGGIYSSGTAALSSVTIAWNEASSAGGDGGDIYNANASAGALTVKDTIVGLAATSGNCGGAPVTSQGHNIDWSAGGGGACAFDASTDQEADPKLPLEAMGDVALVGNGGPTRTIAIPLDSPARDTGAECPAEDQRSVPRPQGAACDIGAYELSLCSGRAVNVTGTAGADSITGTSGPDIIGGFAGNDLISGLAGDDLICAGTGNDTIRPGSGNDTVSGGPGTDTVSFSKAAAGVSVDLSVVPGTASGQGTDRLTGIENVVGSPFADILRGSAGPNSLRGLAGGDRVLGLGGNDLLFGDGGTDTLDGGAGTDVCHYGPVTGPHTSCETYGY